MAEKAIESIEERRLSREERRAKQRAANVGRAAKMHVARLEAEQEQPRLFESLGSKTEVDSEIRYHIGCSGWFYWDWRNCFYPPELKTSEWFDYYASHFRTVELNAPFYAWPTVGTVRTWIRQAGRRHLVYTVKVSELITHVKRFTGTRELVKDFSYIADLLGPRMGCFLFQLPPSFDYTPTRLRQIVSQLDPTRRNVMEFRHASWWNENVYAALKEAGIIFCATSAPRLPDQLVRTADEIYVRFHGTEKWYRHDYAKAELAVWADRIRGCGATKVWAYFNNDYGCHAITNARELLRQLKSRLPE